MTVNNVDVMKAQLTRVLDPDLYENETEVAHTDMESTETNLQSIDWEAHCAWTRTNYQSLEFTDGVFDVLEPRSKIIDKV